MKQNLLGREKSMFGLVIGIVFISILLNSVLWVLAMRYFPKDSPATILHYNSSVGIDFIGQGAQIIMIPVIGTLVIVCNALMGFMLKGVSTRASWMFLGVLPFVQIILLTSFGLIWYLNI